RADVVEGKTALRELGGTRTDAGLHFLLPVALSVCLGQPSGARHGGSGRRLHADPARGVAGSRRDPGDSRAIAREAWQPAGGIASIRGELIDDCALARILKMQGPLWLGLTERARSLRAFHSLLDIRPMISRCAYAQLRYSPWLLLGTVLAIAVTCLAPPLLTVGGTGAAQGLGRGG